MLNRIFRRNRRPTDEEIARELRDHLELEAEATGAPGAEATAAARRRFGNLTHATENVRTVWRRAWWNQLPTIEFELTHALRSIRRRPWQPLLAVLTLAAAIGGTGVMVAASYAVVLRPLPYRSPDQLLAVRQSTDLLSPEDVELLGTARSLVRVGAYTPLRLSLRTGAGGRRIAVAAVDSGFLPTLGVSPESGRPLVAADFTAGAEPVAVVSDPFARRLALHGAALDNQLVLEGTAYTVVGVMPSAFNFPHGVQLWVPAPTIAALHQSQGLWAVARLANGVGAARADAELHVLARDHPRATLTGTVFGFHTEPFTDQARGNAGAVFWMLVSATGMLFLITVGTLANMAMVRATARTRDVAVHAALGASGRQLLGLQITESAMVAAAGTLLGLGAARIVVFLLPRFAAASWMPTDLTIDWAVTLTVASIGALVALTVGLAPLVQFRGLDVQQLLRDGAAGITANQSQRRLRAALIAGELALVVFLVIASAIMIKQYRRIVRMDWGYNGSHILYGVVTLPELRYADVTARREAARTLERSLRAIPGALSATVFGESLPMSRAAGKQAAFEVDQYNGQSRRGPFGAFLGLDADSSYFATMGVRIVRGRGLTARDAAADPPVIVIDESTAAADWPGASPIGRRIRFPVMEPSGPWYSIVGVARNAAALPPFVRADAPERAWRPAMMYRARSSAPVQIYPSLGPPEPGFAFAIRAAGDATQLMPAARRALAALLPDEPVDHLGSLVEYEESIAGATDVRNTTSLLLAFGSFGIVLCLIGIVGIVTEGVARRTREIGIRVALGAQSSDVLALVLHDSAAVTALGVGLGLIVSLAASRLVGHYVFPYDFTSGNPYQGPLTIADPAVLISTVLGVMAVVLGTTVWPALRALRVAPAAALRAE